MAGLGAQGGKVKVELTEETLTKIGKRVSGPREEKLKLKLGKRLGVRMGGGPRGPGRKSRS